MAGISKGDSCRFFSALTDNRCINVPRIEAKGYLQNYKHRGSKLAILHNALSIISKSAKPLT